MPKHAQIEPSDREFFELVARTTACNPFSEARTELDSRIVGHPVKMFSEDHLEEIPHAVSRRVGKLEANGLADVRRYTEKDRELMQTVFLFGIFHEFCRSFDALILEQVKIGMESVPVNFGRDVLARIQRHGISAPAAERFFSIFYQLRRAYYFIVHGLIGKSPCMREFRRRLWQNVFTQDVQLYDQHLWNRMEDFSTLLLGETGTGKGAAAVAIGRSGYIPFDPKQSRFAESFMRSFIALNLSQFPETLIESELFGHRKGAFTGAIEAHKGLLSQCSPHGAIFLDEIGEVSIPIQIKLLQVFQDRTFCAVGSHEPLRFRGRVIAATNRPLEARNGAKLFRDDFYYRLCSDVIHVPPLRRRLREDPKELSELVQHLLKVMLGTPPSALVARMEEALKSAVGDDYAWPGNVRELEQALRRVLLTGHYVGSKPSECVTVRDQLITGIDAEKLTADGLIGGYCRLLHEKLGTYEAVARRIGLDRRTVKKYLQTGSASPA